MAQPVLLIEREDRGEHVRIWRYDDGRFLMERVHATGKGIDVFCADFDEALTLWCRSETDTPPAVPAE